VKNVTIWFQNRRQAARKIALHEAITHSNSQNVTVEHLGLLGEAHSRGRASPVTPEQISTPPHISQNVRNESEVAKSGLDADMFAAALALTQMRSVDSPAP